MMKKQIAGVVFAASIVAGVGAGVLANAVTSEEPASAASGTTPTSAPTPTTSPSATGEPASTPTADTDEPTFTIAPGTVGPVSAGMTKAEAKATGLFDVDVEPPFEGCNAVPLAWKKAYSSIFDVQTFGNGEVASIGVRGPRITTADGLHVGSTFAEVKATLDDGTPVEAGYNQTGLFDFDQTSGGWIGYLFDSTVDDIKDSDTVSFIEVTKGTQPGLMRDGC